MVNFFQINGFDSNDALQSEIKRETTSVGGVGKNSSQTPFAPDVGCDVTCCQKCVRDNFDSRTFDKQRLPGAHRWILNLWNYVLVLTMADLFF